MDAKIQDRPALDEMLTGGKATSARTMILDDAFFQGKTALCFGPFLLFGDQFLVRFILGASFLLGVSQRICCYFTGWTVARLLN